MPRKAKTETRYQRWKRLRDEREERTAFLSRLHTCITWRWLLGKNVLTIVEHPDNPPYLWSTSAEVSYPDGVHYYQSDFGSHSVKQSKRVPIGTFDFIEEKE